jgi:hypothetical protein
MLKIELQIERANLTARLHARLMRTINRAVAENHAEKRVPIHFDERAYRRYRARKRSEKYVKRKKAKFGHNRPNFRTGTLYRSLRKKITATQYGSKLIMSARLSKFIPPDEFAKMNPKARAKYSAKQNRRLADWQKREIAIIIKGEIAEDRLMMARMYKKAAKTPEYQRKRKRRIS